MSNIYSTGAKKIEKIGEHSSAEEKRTEKKQHRKDQGVSAATRLEEQKIPNPPNQEDKTGEKQSENGGDKLQEKLGEKMQEETQQNNEEQTPKLTRNDE